MKPSFKTILPIALLSLTAVTATHAETSDGKTFGVSAGWLHIMPQSSAQGVNSHSVMADTFSKDAGFKAKNADTVGLALDYFVNDNVSLELVLGAPPKIKLSGKGSINTGIAGKPPIDISSFDNIASTEAYTPTFLAKYQFGTVDSKIRPYLGAGLMYAHFSNTKTDAAVDEKITNDMDMHMPLKLGKVSVEDAIAPVVVAGVDYNFSKEWFATASVSYAHLSTKATMDVIPVVNDGKPHAPLLSGKSTIEINPIVTYVGLGYRF